MQVTGTYTRANNNTIESAHITITYKYHISERNQVIA